MRRFGYDLTLFVALLSTAVALGPALAHLFELPNKIGLARDDYFTVQQIYRGWSLLAFILLIEVASMIGVVLYTRTEKSMRIAAILALVCVAGAQGLFWSFTYPANVATTNWTVQPQNWNELRQQWEFSHAGGALLQLLAMASLVVGAINRGRSR